MPVFRFRIRIRMFLGLPDPHPDPLVRGTDPTKMSQIPKTGPGFDPSILQLGGIWAAADESVLNNEHKNKKVQKSPF